MKQKIMLIDDNLDALMVLLAYLSSEGYEVITAQNGEEALAMIPINKPDLIISDIMMPKMGGFEFIEKFSSSNSERIPVIFMSAKDKNIAEKLAMDLGADGFLAKPVSFDLIKATVEAFLKKRQPGAETDKSSENPSFVEQRKNKRVNFICETYFEGGGKSGFTIASNLSRGGLFLDTFSTIPAGTALSMRLKLQPGCEVWVSGEVCYGIKGSGVGIKFIDLDQGVAEIIDRIVEGVLKRSKTPESEAASMA